jgi:S1-C subfamily serine protease
MHRMSPALALVSMMAALASCAKGADRPTLKDALALEEVFQEAIKRAEPSIACIAVARDKTTRLDDPDAVPESFGSGVVLGTSEGRGLVLTNFHVVREAARLFVCLAGQKGSYADIFAADARSDLAVLRLQAPVPVKPIKLGDGDHVRKGQIVLSLANPFAAGFPDGSPSASWGIVSNIRRRAPGRPVSREQDLSRLTLHHYGTLLQIDARLNLGCSGGALIDLKGELIGLTTSQAALAGGETAGGFAIPMNARMHEVVKKLLEGKEVEYGFLGVTFSREPPGLRDSEGVRIESVIRGSPAQQASLTNWDVIRSVNGMPVRNNEDLLLAIGTLLAGSKAHLRVSRFNMPVTVTLAKYYVPGPIIATNKPPAVHGLRVDYTSVLMQRTNPRGEIPQGVYVSEVVPGSAAEIARLQDAVITQVNGQAVDSPADFYRAAAKRPGPLELTVANRLEKVKLD